MARRSARLQKRSPTPALEGNSNLETAPTGQTPQKKNLASVSEHVEFDSAMKAPPRPAVQDKRDEKPKPASKLPQPSNTATPHKNTASTSLLSALSTTTPKDRIANKPASELMHPEHYHPNTVKVLDKTGRLGVQVLGSQTAPPKATESVVLGDATPSKTQLPTPTPRRTTVASSPAFKFSFKAPISALSPTASRILQEGEEKDALSTGPGLFDDKISAAVDISPRKMAKPKGKKSRFSDAHMAEFKKMDSIANHPSAFRADPNRFKPASAFLKRTQSKTELDKEMPTVKGGNKLKRTQSKMDMTESKMDPPAPKLIATPLKHAQKEPEPSKSNPPRSQSTVRLVPSSRDGGPGTSSSEAAPKRFKRKKEDDAASTRPPTQEEQAQPEKAKTPALPLQSHRRLPRPTSRLMTPTKASLMRSQSAKTVKTTSMLPSLFRSPSAKTLLSPTNIGETVKEGVREGLRKTSDSLHKMRSILRTPRPKFSDDPAKIAAGTHMSPPPFLGFTNAFPHGAATTPRKHVNFTSSTLEKAARDELANSPSPVKVRASSEASTSTVPYPKLHDEVDYPELASEEETSPTQPVSRRLTFGDATETASMPFSFQSDTTIKFDDTSSGTIRMVRKSDASSLAEGKKRKIETFEQGSDKENVEPTGDEMRSAKKPRTASAEPPKTPSNASKLPRRTPNARGSTISKSRLAFLATPKRSKA
ncbi:uncharacterized protein EI97DRAFT_435809 [Westerdykella ornata]|uniref:Erythromycin esterase n=1 Tax=Westerdykella ornata TaxID=318751 RepID=A0A6A6JBK5_WESOR|nr:uncharacterized protein EI97DRAFT_435809 [Westerdykella ornata]KAF2273637.1 hypothetical protein EI97DRAFT_435809 [Westerdykella ornata]